MRPTASGSLLPAPGSALLLGGDGLQLLVLEGRQFGLHGAQPLDRCLPALLKRGGDQAVGGVDGLIAPLGKVDLVAGSLDPPLPLGGDRLIARLQRGQRVQGEVDRRRRHRDGQPGRDPVVQGGGGERQAGARRQRLPVLQRHWYIG